MYTLIPSTAPNFTPILGLAYTILNGQFDGNRVTFRYAATEMIRSWCELQTSYPTDTTCTGFRCVSDFGGFGFDPGGGCYIIASDAASSDSPQRAVSCGVMQHCGVGGCVCNASRCTADPSIGIPFDLTFNWDEVTGVSNGRSIRMHRVIPADD